VYSNPARVRRDARLGADVRVDLREAERLARAEVDGGAERSGAESDTETFVGDLLPDWYDDWVLIERERFRQLRLRALEALCERLPRAGRVGGGRAGGGGLGQTVRTIRLLPGGRNSTEGLLGEILRRFWICARHVESMRHQCIDRQKVERRRAGFAICAQHLVQQALRGFEEVLGRWIFCRILQRISHRGR